MTFFVPSSNLLVAHISPSSKILFFFFAYEIISPETTTEKEDLIIFLESDCRHERRVSMWVIEGEPQDFIFFSSVPWKNQ